jgi:hypothetical protein
LGKPTPWPKESAGYRISLNLAEPQPASGLIDEVLQVGGQVPVEESARLETLGSSNKTGSGVRMFFIDEHGHGIMLDGMRMEHVVVTNAVVVYNGGPVRLLDVRFVNCEFRMKRISPAVDLAQTLLRPASATFSSAVS